MSFFIFAEVFGRQFSPSLTKLIYFGFTPSSFYSFSFLFLLLGIPSAQFILFYFIIIMKL